VLPTVRDDAEEISETIASVSQADLLLTTGGASVGDFDYMKDVIGRGGELNFWRVRGSARKAPVVRFYRFSSHHWTSRKPNQRYGHI